MAVFKCKMCGGNLEIAEGVTVGECEYCGTRQTLPRVGEESIANLFNRANRLRMHCEFDKAEEVYEKIINLDDSESEAHWGMVLCKYGIEYVEDPNTFERIPTCHRTSFEAVTEDNDYLVAIENADAIRREIYQKEAQRIEELQKDVLKIVDKEKSFDVFICYKETDETGERTTDSVLAQDIYDQLTEKGYRVFFARITLEDKLGHEYEPYIFAALNSAKVMLVIGTKAAYMESVWVRNEWSRYLKIMKKDHAKLLIPCYKDMDPYDMPEAFSHLQAQNLAKIGAVQDLIRGIGKIVKSDDNAAVAYTLTSNNTALIDNAMSYLRDGNFAIAATTCDQILKTDSENSMAYVCKLMAELKIKEFAAKNFWGKKYKKNANYKKAMEYADDYVNEKFSGIESAIKKVKRKIKFSIISSVASIFLIIIACFVIAEIKYDSAVERFYAETEKTEYQKLVNDFAALNGYRSSEAYCFFSATLRDGAPGGFAMGAVKNITKLEIPDKPELLEIMVNHGQFMQTCFPNVQEVSFEGEIETIPYKFFANLNKLSKIEIPRGVTAIAEETFCNCENLTSITIPDTVKSIGRSAFFSCNSLTSITIPDSVTSIGSLSFFETGYYDNPDNWENGVLYISNHLIDSKYTINSEYVVRDGTIAIVDHAFLNCSTLTSITIPGSVTSIGNSAFDACSKLRDVYYEGSEIDREKIEIAGNSKLENANWHYNSSF